MPLKGNLPINKPSTINKCGYPPYLLTAYIYILRRFQILSSVILGLGTPSEIFNVCGVSQLFTVGQSPSVCLHLEHFMLTGLVRQEGFGYGLCLETPLPKYTATLSCVGLCSMLFSRFSLSFSIFECWIQVQKEKKS